MPTDPRKRQKKKEKQAAKRKAKHHALVRAKSAGLTDQLAGTSRYPVLHSWVSDTVWEDGIGQVCLSRELPGERVAVAVFLVDRFCLGIKDAMAQIMSRFTYDSKVIGETGRQSPRRQMTPACVRKFVEGAVAYAEALGLHPHADYEAAKLVFGNIDPAECAERFEYGKDGKPYFVAGPYDTPARSRRILAALERSCGPGGYHYMMPVLVDTGHIAGSDDVDEAEGDE